MKKYLLALCLFALSPQLAMAQDAITAVVPEKVTYSRAVPKALGAFVPRGGKSRFWGATKLQFEGKPVWVHVYDVRRAREDAPQKSALDLFIFSNARKLKRIISKRFEYQRLDDFGPKSKPETIGVKTLWLDLNDKTRPIFEIKINGDKSIYGDEIQYIFAIFSQDFKSAAIDNQFGEFSAVTSNTSVSFDVDEAGLLSIVYSDFGPAGTSETTYNWLKNSFKPVRKRFQDRSENAEFKSVPLTR